MGSVYFSRERERESGEQSEEKGRVSSETKLREKKSKLQLNFLDDFHLLS